MSLSNYLEQEILDHLIGAATWTAPSTLYLALFTSDPGEDASGTEVSGSGYSRQAMAMSRSGSVIDNDALESFTASGGNFGTVTHWAVFDAASGGNMLFYGSLDTSRTINDGETGEAAAGAVTLTLD